MQPVSRFNAFGLGLLLAAMAARGAPSALAEIRATGKNGLKTEVNGLRGGRCNKDVCRITGGTNAGQNKFHRFKEFDTRGAIKRVEFDTGGKRNLIVGVTSPKGSWIDKALSMSLKANLFFLSPGGLHVGKGAEFINVPRLTLSTADQLKFSEVCLMCLTAHQAAFKIFRPIRCQACLGCGGARWKNQWCWPLESCQIHLNGINIGMDEELLVDAPGGQVVVSGSRLDVGTGEVGGRIALTADSIVVDGESELM